MGVIVVKRIAFLGTGAMGAPMALRLRKAGYPLGVWNRTRAKAEHLTDDGAEVFDTAVEAVDGADVVVTMLETGIVVDDVLFNSGVWAAIAQGSTLIDMSSIPPATARDHAARLGLRGIGYLDAPVSGGTRGAVEGTLAIMVGGEPSVVDRCSDVLSVFGNATHVGPAGSGQVTKLANQIIVGITIGAVAEALSLVRASGVDPAVARRALKGGFADSRILEEHGARMIDRDFGPGAASRIQLKDLATALGTAEELGLDLPITSVLETMFDSLCASGGSELDHSALLLEIERAVGQRSIREQE
ncbi:MAG: NAD(P)-dependent oxidoreductase [Acidimicrobiia bacterium]|nr:MAG: NAD(P)-dependent oxidoreductase [Acidimicrobiia bacterium]